VRSVARNASALDQAGYTCGFAAVAAMSDAATSRLIVMRGSTLKHRGIRLSRAMILLRDGVGAISMILKSIWEAKRRTPVQSRASCKIEFDRDWYAEYIVVEEVGKPLPS
jgi:hypothetical protein